MFDDFWKDAVIIDAYTDKEAVEDGFIIDINNFNVFFNGKVINRVTCECSRQIGLLDNPSELTPILLQDISIKAKYDGEGEDAWGIIEKYNGHKLWLIPNEVKGYTLMLPSDY